MQPQHTRPPTCLGRSGTPPLQPGAVLPGDDLHGWVLLGFQLAMAWVVYRTARESERRVAETIAQLPSRLTLHQRLDTIDQRLLAIEQRLSP